MNEACGTCKFGMDTNHFDETACRRHAPVIVPIVTTNRHEATINAWPLMSREHGWCGDYAARADIERSTDG